MWKDIDGCEGYYKVSSSGQVMCLDRNILKSNGVSQHRSARMARIYSDKDGYPRVKLNKNGKSKVFCVHRLVAMAFVPGYEPGKEVNHKDCDRSNNSYDNLEWLTHVENVRHSASAGHYSGKIGEKNPNYGNRSLRARFCIDPSFRMVQSRPGEQNGRSIPVTMVYDGTERHFACISHCADTLISCGLTNSTNTSYIASKISAAAKQGRMYLGRTFII